MELLIPSIHYSTEINAQKQSYYVTNKSINVSVDDSEDPLAHEILGAFPGPSTAH